MSIKKNHKGRKDEKACQRINSISPSNNLAAEPFKPLFI